MTGPTPVPDHPPFPPRVTEIFDVPGRGSTVRATDETFLRVTAVPTTPGLTEAVAAAVADHEHQARRSRWTATCPTIHLRGGCPILDTVEKILTGAGAQVTRTGPVTEGLVVHSSSPPFPEESTFETHVPALPLTVEGAIVYIGPLRLDTSDASPSQSRRRRHAAATAGRELAHWHLHARPDTSPLPRYSALAAAWRTLEVLRAWHEQPTERNRLRTILWRHDALRFASTEHVVLGYDAPTRPR